MEKKARKALAEEIAISIAFVLKKADEKAAGKVLKHISAAAKQIVKRFDRHLPDASKKGNAEKKKSVVKVAAKVALKKTKVTKSAATKAVRKTTAAKVKA